MASTKGAEVRLAAPGPWAPRRIAFHATSTYSSAAMGPLNEPVVRGESAGGGGSRVGGGQLLQQVNSKHGRSDPQSLPSIMPLQWTAPQKIGAGLSNLGNTCFLNSVLQCLTYTPPLAGYLLSGQHKAFCRVAGFCAFCALQEHVQQTLASSGKVVSPQKLAKNLRSISRSFRMGRQEDSHEYMRYLLDALHKCCLPPDLAKNSNSKSSQEKSLVYRIFGGQLRSQVRCTVCSHCSNTYDPFLDLSLEIVRADSLTKALTRFTAVDVLDGDNKYRCPRCKKKVRALKQFTIDTVPNILTVQFKRFGSSGGHGGKIDKRVEFGTTLDLKRFVSNGQDSVPNYKLFGVLVHSGWSTHSGHYYCFLRASSDIWHVFDDSRVRQVSEKTVLDQKAYMLFYVREGKRASNSHSETIPKQTSSHCFSVFTKERERIPDSEVISARALSRPVTVLSKGSETSLDTALLPEQVSAGLICVVPQEIERCSQAPVIPKRTPCLPMIVVNEEASHDTVHVEDTNGDLRAISEVPTRSVNDHGFPAAVTSVAIPGSVEDTVATVARPSGPVAEGCVPAIEKEVKRMEIDNCCTTSGNSGAEDNWDEYYKKGWNVPGSTPQNFLKMLRVIPSTRRYYQARAVVVRRSSKVPSLVNGELEIEISDNSEALSANVKKDAKRQHAFNEEVRGSKKQHRELGGNCGSSSCMLSEESTEKEITPGIGLEPIVQESISQGRGESAFEGNGLSADCCSRNKPDDLRVVQRLTLITDESRPDSSLNTSEDHTKDVLEKRDWQHSGAELRVVANVANNCQLSEIDDCGLRGQTFTNRSSSNKGLATVVGNALPMTRNELYGTAVSRWDEVVQDEHLVKEIDKLLEPEKDCGFKQDIWDVEYDRGRSKKVRNKTSRETHDADMSSYAVGNGTSKSENPFEAAGIANQAPCGPKAGNGEGRKEWRTCGPSNCREA